MLGWLRRMTFPDGSLPHFNDTTEGIALGSDELLEIAGKIGLRSQQIKLKESGYRIFEHSSLRLVADIEGIKPSYQPGHAHADTFSFVLHDGVKPLIVDPGISTYAISERRSWERSTKAHNTLTIDRQNSSQVWSGFRVGKRANVKVLIDEEGRCSAEHNGFGRQIHTRIFETVENGFRITDRVSNPAVGALLEIRFFFHPNISVEIMDTSRVKVGQLTMNFDNASAIQLEDYKYCSGYNKLIPSKFILVTLAKDRLATLITFN